MEGGSQWVLFALAKQSGLGSVRCLSRDEQVTKDREGEQARP